MRHFFPLLLIFITACAPNPPLDVETTPQLVSVYVAPSVEEWIPLVYNCAERSPFGVVARSQDIVSADISLRLSVPKDETIPFYQIGEVELVAASAASATSATSNAKNLSLELTRAQVRAIFEGRITNWAQVGGDDAEIQLWVYGQDNDLQAVFNGIILEGGRLSSLARQAQNQKEMRREIAEDANAIGIISYAQVDENLHILHSFGKFPVLAIPMEEPQGIVFSLLSCLQGE